jgi:septal ring factor EnvC (AmiA/AmiB activator)
LQVTGSSVAVVPLEGQLAERERALSDLEARLHASQEEAGALREELTALRSQLEAGLESRLAEADREATAAREEARAASDAAQALGARVEGPRRPVAGAAERLAVVEDRQAQKDREIFSDISRAVPARGRPRHPRGDRRAGRQYARRIARAPSNPMGPPRFRGRPFCVRTQGGIPCAPHSTKGGAAW